MTTDEERRPPAGTGEAATAPSVDGAATPIVDESDIAAWMAERVAAREAQHAQRRAWLDHANAEHRQAREHGLRARHARKLRRGGGRDG